MASFEVDAFEELHGQVVSGLVSGAGASDPHVQAALFDEVRKKKDSLSHPLAFRSREDTVDLPSLARHVAGQHPRLASEPLVRAVDEVSRALRLHQHDACRLVEHALGPTEFVSLAELPQRCAAMYFRECHFQTLCLHDMAFGLGQRPPDRCSVAFFGMLGGAKFVKALFEALALLLRDLASERSADQAFLLHAGAMIRLSVETLLSYFFAFRASAEEAEQVISLLPHVVMSQHAPLGQAFTMSDLDLVLRENHADIGTKLSLALLCIVNPRSGNGRLDMSRLPADATPASVRIADLEVQADQNDVAFASTPFGGKVRSGTFWNEEHPLGQFLSFAVNGVLLEDEKALRNGYVHWSSLHFILHEILLSPSIVGDACTGRLVLRCIHDLLAQALLPIGRRWIAIRKLEVQAVSYRMLTPDALQIAVLQALNRLCRVHPPSCDAFREIALHCTDTFHLAVAAPGGGAGPMPWAGAGAFPLRRPEASPRRAPGGGAVVAQRHDGSMLYAEILDLLASVCARGSLHCVRLVCQRLVSHSNQWFNWGFLMDALLQAARRPSLMPAQQQHQHQQHLYGAAPDSQSPTPVVVSLCHLLSAVCSTRLSASLPPPQVSIQALQMVSGGAGASPVESSATLLLELLGAHNEPAVKAACLGALAHLDLPPAFARSTFQTLSSMIPTLMAGVNDSRGCQDGSLSIELLACAIQLVQSVPLRRGRFSLDLLPLTRIVLHHVLMRVLADPAHFSSASRFWRLAALALKWLRLVLRGPLPLGASSALNLSLIRFYADSEATAAEVAHCTAAGNATAYALRSLLVLDSPVFAQVMRLTLLHGAGADGLLEKRDGGASRALMEQAVYVGLDIVRLLLQRDVLFSRLYSQHAADGAAGGHVDLNATALPLTHSLLFAEFPFAYPPTVADSSGASKVSNPFCDKRLWLSAAAARSEAGLGGRKSNPSHLSLLLEFAGVRGNARICRLAIFAFSQCALREPALVLRTVQLEPWRLQKLCADFHHRLTQPEEDNDAQEIAIGPPRTWDARAESHFMAEAGETDAPSSGEYHLDVVSSQTALPVCRAMELTCQLADDAAVQAADLVAWATGFSGMLAGATAMGPPATASVEAWRFDVGYLRGVETPASWLHEDAGGPDAEEAPPAALGVPPPPALSTTACRLLLLRSVMLLLGGGGPASRAGALVAGARPGDEAGAAASHLAQVLLGLDPGAVALGASGALSASGLGGVDVDVARAGQPSLLDALFELLEHPPPHFVADAAPGDRGLSGALRPVAGLAQESDLAQCVHQHSTYESALSVLLALLAAPLQRDVALRYMCFAWPSRHQVLRQLLGTQWLGLPTTLLRVLLSETGLMLQIAAWEMRVVRPLGAGPPQQSQCLGLAWQERFEMQRAVAEQLREVVQSFSAPGELLAQGSPPFLVDSAARLADACDAFQDDEGGEAAAPPGSSCRCMAPCGSGYLALCLELQDPFVLACLASVQGAAPRKVGARNRRRCVAFLANAAWTAMGLFFQASLCHLGDSGRRHGAPQERGGEGECALRLLEALLPALCSGRGPSATAPSRFEFLAKLVVALLMAMQRRSGTPASLAFVHGLYGMLRDVALHPAASQEVRRCAHQSLLVLVQRMLPEAAAAGAGRDVVSGEPGELRAFIKELLSAACGMADDDTASPPSVDGACVALALSAALLSHVPAARQQAELLGAGDTWLRLTRLLQGASRTATLATLVVAALCRAPGLATRCFESGCLAALLGAELERPVAAASPLTSGLQLSATLAVLQVLVAVATSLPSHALALTSIVAWVERHRGPLAELLRWLTRLPVATAADLSGLDGRLGSLSSGLRAASAGASWAPSEEGRAARAPHILVCAGSEESARAQAALALRLIRSPGSGGDTEEDRVAESYECARLLAELWALLQANSTGLGGDLAGRLRRLEPTFADAFGPLLAQMAVAVSPDGLLARSQEGVAANAMSVDSAGARPEASPQVGPPESVRLGICLHVLHAWRHDRLAELLATAGSGQQLVRPPSFGGAFFEDAPSSERSSVSSCVPVLRQRAEVLLGVFAHACEGVLGLRLAQEQGRAVWVGPASPSTPQLLWQGAKEHYRLLHAMVEVSLHLLRAYLGALLASADLRPSAAAPPRGAPSPLLGAARFALVAQGLRELREFAAAVGGALLLAPGAHEAAQPTDPSQWEALDWTFATCMAERVEEQLLQLQTF